MGGVEANRALTLKRGQSLLDLLISHAIIPDGRNKTSRKRQSPPAQPQSKSYCARAGYTPPARQSSVLIAASLSEQSVTFLNYYFIGSPNRWSISED